MSLDDPERDLAHQTVIAEGADPPSIGICAAYALAKYYIEQRYLTDDIEDALEAFCTRLRLTIMGLIRLHDGTSEDD